MELKGKDIFRRRVQEKTVFILTVVFLYAISSLISGFDDILSFLTVPKGIFWLLQKFIPSGRTLGYLPKMVKPVVETILLSSASTLISSVFALVMALGGSEATGVSAPVKAIVKVTASFFRNMPLVAWALLLLFSFKQSRFTGLLTLTFVTFGYLTRAFTETIDETAGDIMEALQATGATWWQIIFQGVLPGVSSQLVSWILYYMENSIRESALIGMLTGTGIGFMFNLYYRSQRYDAAGLVIGLVTVLVMLIELLSNKIRKELL